MQLALLPNSKEIVLKQLVAMNAEQMEGQSAEPGRGGSSKVKTVANTFKVSLDSLMSTIQATTPHYCRCLKTNQLKKVLIIINNN